MERRIGYLRFRARMGGLTICPRRWVLLRQTGKTPPVRVGREFCGTSTEAVAPFGPRTGLDVTMRMKICACIGSCWQA